LAKVTKAIVIAGGMGGRFSGHYIPKQFVEINSKPILAFVLETIQSISEIAETILVINADYKKLYDDIIQTYNIQRVVPVPGGDTRQESIGNGLKAAGQCDYVVIQNGVCPLTSKDLILNVLNQAVESNAGASAYVEVIDTVVSNKNGMVDEYLERSSLVKLQAPQAFPLSLIKTCHAQAVKDKLTNVTNDADLIHRYGYKMHLVKGAFNNIKVTTTEDWLLAKVILGEEIKNWVV